MKLEGQTVDLSRYCQFIVSLLRSLCGDIEDSGPVLNIAVSNSSRLTTPVLSHLGVGRWSEYEYANSSFDHNCFGSRSMLCCEVLRTRLLGLSVKPAIQVQ